jgi:hypothetical protein
MPVVTDKPTITTLTQQQNNCNICNGIAPRNKHIATCSICTKWLCLECTKIPEKVIKAAASTETNLSIVCPKCEENLPKIRNLLTIQQEQESMKTEISDLKANVATNHTLITTCNADHTNIISRLEAVEQTINKHHLSDKDFPLLSTVVAGTKTLQKDFTDHKTKTTGIDVALKKQQTDKEEEQRRDAKKTSLIVYGVKETHVDDKITQMKEDFKTLRQLYSNRVEINKDDFTNISRVGNQKPQQIRPIKITFINPEKRNKILTNNKDLKIYSEEYEECSRCDDEESEKHVHVYITTDKTKQEREEENALRATLKARRDGGELDLIIKKGKIINKTEAVHPRWADVRNDGY